MKYYHLGFTKPYLSPSTNRGAEAGTRRGIIKQMEPIVLVLLMGDLYSGHNR
jgi:hypothetical protein